MGYAHDVHRCLICYKCYNMMLMREIVFVFQPAPGPYDHDVDEREISVETWKGNFSSQFSQNFLGFDKACYDISSSLNN